MTKYLIVIILFLNLTFTNIFSQNGKYSDELQIVGGKNAKIEDYPWQVALFSVNEQGNIDRQGCGGSIIDEYWIMTAAHCVGPSSVTRTRIVAGITSLSNAKNGQIIDIAEVIIHPGYKEDPINNDIALLRLANPINLKGEKAKSIEMLKKEGEDNGIIEPGIMATITGWGTTTYHGNSPDILQVGSAPIISIETANQWFAEAGGSGNWKVTEEMLPIGYEKGGVSGCHGDSGGPLVVKDENQNWILAGITSWGNICGGAKQPAVYTRVSYFDNWIESHTQNFEKPQLNDKLDIIKFDGRDPIVICDNGSLSGELVIRNFGKNELSSFKLNVDLGKKEDELINVYSDMITFEPPVPSGGTRRIPLSNIIISDTGAYFIKFTVQEPNTKIIFEGNDELITKIHVLPPHIVKVKIDMKNITNCSYMIYEASTYQMIYQQNFFNKKDEVFEDSICLPTGDYYMSTYYNDGADAEMNTYIKIGEKEYNIAAGQSNYNTYFGTYFTIPFVPVTDMVIIANTVYNTNDIYLCDLSNQKMFNIRLQNRGTVVADSIVSNIEFNGIEDVNLFQYKLNPSSSYTIPLDNVNLSLANNLKVAITQFKSEIEENNIDNNKSELNFNVIISEPSSHLQINTDNDSWQNEWQIVKKSDGNLVAGGNFFDFPAGVVFLDTLCLPANECYKFRISDYGGNGISKPVAVTMKKPDGSVLFEIKGNEIGAFKEIEFCNSTTSVEDDVRSEDITIYPTPADDFIYITNQGNNLEFSIYDLVGNQVMTGIVQNGINRINISNFGNGSYFVSFKNGKFNLTKRFNVFK